MKQRLASLSIYVATTAIGAIAFLYPFWLPQVPQAASMGMAHANDGPFMLSVLVGLCLAVLLVEVQGQAVNTKSIALLGILVAINSVLRFAEVALPGPGGFTPVFFLIILTGYVYGARLGFLMGALTLFVSALITGGVGPWLPYQMFTAGWMGMTAPLCRPAVRGMRGEGRLKEVILLALFGALWGLVYGAIMNIWFWPFIVGPASQSWLPGMTLTEALRHYAVFYLVTSLVWDLMSAIGTAALVLTLGMPVLRSLRRFHRRFDFVHHPAPAPSLAGLHAGGVRVADSRAPRLTAEELL